MELTPKQWKATLESGEEVFFTVNDLVFDDEHQEVRWRQYGELICKYPMVQGYCLIE